MNKNILLAIGITILFLSVVIQPIVAKDIISPLKKSDTKELLETIKDLANNKEIQNIIQKSEIKSSPIRFQQLLGRLQKEIIGAIEKNDVLNKRLNQLSELPCDCEKDNNPLWYPRLICFPLIALWFISGLEYYNNGHLIFFKLLLIICGVLLYIFHCPSYYGINL